MDRTERFYKIDQLLRERRVLSFAAPRKALDISRATLSRLVRFWRSTQLVETCAGSGSPQTVPVTYNVVIKEPKG